MRAILVFAVCHLLTIGFGAEDAVAPLPRGIQAVWDINKAERQSTPTRERICLNGLWQWQPAEVSAEAVPAANWGWFKVPGCWPGITDYMQKDCQTLFKHPGWAIRNLSTVSAAWYQRNMTVPREWTGRRVTVTAEYLNSFAAVYVDGRRAGEIHFPGGDMDITALCKPGETQQLSLLVIAMPLKGVMLSYSDTFGAKQVQGKVERRGLCGDVYLNGTPTGARIADVKVSTSVRNWEITFDAALQNLVPDAAYALRAQITDNGHIVSDFVGESFKASDLKLGRLNFSKSWKPEKIWDTHTPQNTYEVRVSLMDAAGRDLDESLSERFGFREFWIEGRDLYLNGSRIFLCAVPLDNAQIGAVWATYDAARESMQRLKNFGINFVYTHNYGCEPGAHLSFAEILRAADEEGVLVSFSQPHFSQYQWKSRDADQTNGYARHAAFYVRAAGNHPSIVFYSMSHNSTGTEEQMNPDLIDGIHDVRNQWSSNNVKQALRAEAIVNRLDHSRIVYHHSSANLGSMHTANFYANFAPIQEMSDWLKHWATEGVKPLFLCEYGVPIFWDWMMYRGWYKGVREFGSAQVPWEFCLAEWDAQFFGDQAYKLTELEKECIRWEAKRFRAGQVWHRWDYPRNAIESPDFEQRNEVMAMYVTNNLRAFRTWGISAFCPWDHGTYWKLRDGISRARKELKVDWASLQRPGFSPDYIDSQMEWINTSFERSDWIPTAAGRALIRNNQPLLAYIGGKTAAFTSKDHNFYAGETVEKQLIIINNSRQKVSCDCNWSLALPEPVSGRAQVSVETGDQVRVPISFNLPAALPPGRYAISATVKFSSGETQADTFTIDVLLRPTRGVRPSSVAATPGPASGSGKYGRSTASTAAASEDGRTPLKIALFDPKGETAKLLKALDVRYSKVDANVDLSAYDILVVGKEALTTNGLAPDIARVRGGLKVIMFEQTPEVLEQRFGFRVAQYGLRRVFKRVPDHSILGGIAEEHLADWRGEATLLPPRLQYEIGQRHAPEVRWCDIPVTRLWRAGNRGNVASDLIEKPACGDFMPILDGGFGLQFSPLLEYREGKGMMLLCQLDVTGRTENDPAADALARNIIQYAITWKPAANRKVIYAGNSAGQRHLEQAGFATSEYREAKLALENVLVVGAGGGKMLDSHKDEIAQFLGRGGNILVLGLDDQEANSFLPFKVTTRNAEHIGAFFEPAAKDSLIAGLGPADVHIRDPRNLPLVTAGAAVLGDGVVASVQGANIVFCQLPPYEVLAGSDTVQGQPQNIRKTFRRASYLLTRLLANMGAASPTPILERFHQPVSQQTEARWRAGLYLDLPEEWDDPYRFFCW